jgi:phosphate-selective porin OprO and OprP
LRSTGDRRGPRRGLISAGAMLILTFLAPAAGAQEAASVPEIPLPEEPAQVPDAELLQWSLVAHVQGDLNVATSADDEDTRAAILRRARISLIADWGFDWRFLVSGDAGKFSGLRDLYAEYRRYPVYVAAGRMVEPFGLLQGGSSGAALMERPQPAALAPGYGLGVQANYAGQNWAVTVGAFDAAQNEIELGGRKEEALTGRLTLVPFRAEASLVHAALNVSRRDSGDGLAQFDAIPETALLERYNTQSAIWESNAASPGTEKYWIYGVEGAWKIGAVMLQGEFLQTRFDHTNTRNPSTDELERIPSPRYNGYYLEAAWVLTGEQRDYSTRRGVFGYVYPDAPLGSGGLGAFEIAARGSVTDLRYDVRYHGPTGDYGEVGSVGINWYPNDSAKAMLEFVQIRRTSHGSVGYSVGDPANPSVEDWIVQARLQWYFVAP